MLKICHHPLIEVKLSIMRDAKTKSKEFRESLDEIGSLMTYEVFKDLEVVESKEKMLLPTGVLLNKKKLSIEAIERIFNWNSEELFRIMLSSKNTLLKYDADINCFDMLNALRFSFLGSQGITGGKNIGDQFRDIYPSHLGRIDLNGISHGKNQIRFTFMVTCSKRYLLNCWNTLKPLYLLYRLRK